jgi:hypothetical protein
VVTKRNAMVSETTAGAPVTRDQLIAALGVGAGLSDARQFASGVPFSNLHVTLTGTGPQFDAELG